MFCDRYREVKERGRGGDRSIELLNKRIEVLRNVCSSAVLSVERLSLGG